MSPDNPLLLVAKAHLLDRKAGMLVTAQPSLQMAQDTEQWGAVASVRGWGGTVPEGAAGAESLFCQLPRSGGSGSPVTLRLGGQSVTRYSILDPEHFQHPLTPGLHPDFLMVDF